MSSPGTRRDHDRFCQVEVWELVRNARGERVRPHIVYKLALYDGRILRTRISRPPANETYPIRLWDHILTTQLDVTESQFWACVRKRQPPNRGAPPQPPAGALPLSLVHQLVHEAGVSQNEIFGMSLDRALEILHEYWSRPKDGSDQD